MSNSELLERVKKGNTLLMKEWLDFYQDDKWEYHMKRADSIADRLHPLCLQLMLSGYNKCLYEGEAKECCKPFVCLVCPKS